MADPITLAVVGLAVSTTATAGAHVMQGRAQAEASAFEQQQLKALEQNQRTAAAQLEARKTEELTKQLEAIQAVRSGRGVGEASPSGRAILDSVTANVERDIHTERLGILEKADQSRLAGIMAGKKASTSLLSGYLTGVSDVGAGAYKYGTIGKPGGTYATG